MVSEDAIEDTDPHDDLQTGLQLHLGHGGVPCPSASANEPVPLSGQLQHATVGKDGDQAKDDRQDTQAMDDGEWEDVDNIPLHLRLPVGSKYLTIIDVTGVAFCTSATMPVSECRKISYAAIPGQVMSIHI
ncbi:hypothetical protein PISMIDRAFT_18029 [Pisolithus microcarpus 441]|uniref:Uncharacterized protein n=1 Tax=Pisolithus microcarpus 441 TaxID=765257 RepID=A0A0C9YSU1_9AGAM|nr:hypothetical protein PISMIDRAFT_18029 [Pisolithus microcarpus 441]